MLVKNTEFRLDLNYYYFNGFIKGRRIKLLEIYPLRGIHIIDLNYLNQIYGNQFVEKIKSKISDYSIFDLGDKDTNIILDYIKDLTKGYIKVKIKTSVNIDYIYKRGLSLIYLVEHRRSNFSFYLKANSFKSLCDEKELIERALSRFPEIYKKSFDRKILNAIVKPENLKKHVKEEVSEYIRNHPNPFLTGLIITSMLSRRENKNYLRI